MAATKEARGRRDSVRRQQILDTALALFSAKAYEDVSVDDVSEAAGVAHGLISYYFGNKRGLFAAAVSQAWKELVDFERPTDEEITPAERVHGFVRRHFQYVCEHPTRFATLMRTGHADRDVYEIIIGARGQAMADLQLTLGCPVNPPAHLRAALRAWMGYLDSMTLDWALHRDLDLNFVTDLCVQALVASVRASSGETFDATEELDALGRVATPSPTAMAGALPSN
ncbi:MULTISPECIES: TetR/AcrR family transcriptional regulator [Rhodococcus]|uniref:TetR/AcrR family transcriptional regulator n=1 Tax=Rhodococcus TaxID=1827 RepID=UPI0021BAC3FD|nr:MULTISPECIES: TetR/AcrR family transcriptional regulator [Rhodococcus]MBQ7804037.1 TetR/AcrR family transcriptional regulator [Rhodococcus sp. (in: high G+C Gram-positive bacteria)]UXF67275.1 TetR family transcriptional regulator [Rhodococcus qingshengii]